MYSKLFLISAVVSTAFADDALVFDSPGKSRAVSDVEQYASTITDSPAFSSLINDVQSSIAPSAVSAILDHPEDVAYDIANSQGASLIGALPTPVVEDLRAILSKPIQAFGDLDSVLSDAITASGAKDNINAVASAAPDSVKSEIKASPVDFLEALITDSTVPAWISAVPTDIQSGLADVIDAGLSLIAEDFEATGSATKSASASKTASPGANSASGSKSGPSSTSSVTAFQGAGSKVQVGAAAGALVAFVGLVMAL